MLAVRFHPTRSHLFLLGGDTGAVCLWDVRSGSRCTTPAHTGPLYGMATLADAPDAVFTVGQDGALVQGLVNEKGPSLTTHTRLGDALPLSAVAAYKDSDGRSVKVLAGGDSGILHTVTL